MMGQMARLRAVSAALILLIPAVPVGATNPSPDLSGRWKLNEERSDDARKKIEEAREGERRGKGGLGGLGPLGPGPRGGGPMGGGPMGGRPLGGRPRLPDDGTRAAGPMSELTNPPKMLVITQAAGELTFDSGDDTVLRLRPDGRKVKREGGAVELKGRWKDGELVVEAEREDGSKTVTTYRVTSDRQELHVTTRLQGVLDEVIIRRIYDAAPPQ
jgi:hypothetical protein